MVKKFKFTKEEYEHTKNSAIAGYVMAFGEIFRNATKMGAENAIKQMEIEISDDDLFTELFSQRFNKYFKKHNGVIIGEKDEQ